MGTSDNFLKEINKALHYISAAVVTLEGLFCSMLDAIEFHTLFCLCTAVVKLVASRFKINPVPEATNVFPYLACSIAASQ